MAEDLKEIIDYLKNAEMVQIEEAANLEILTAITLDEHPLCDYLPEEKTAPIEVVITGSSPMREAFFRNIFAGVQMPNRALHIRFIAKDAAQFCNKLMQDCPMLNNTVSFTVDGITTEQLDEQITKSPLAYLYFYTEMDTKAALEKLLSARTDIRYFLLADTISAKTNPNYSIATWLTKQFDKARENVFIGFGDLRGDGVSLQSLDHAVAFPMTASYEQKDQEKEEHFEDAVVQRAFDIHKSYADKNASAAAIRKDFESPKGNFYNKRSSVRAALSFPYKLAACGLYKRDRADVKRFYDWVLGDEPDEKKRNEQLFLEHRSWLCFVILDGWKRPTTEQVEEYAYENGNDHRNKKEKLHPCMVDSTEKRALADLEGTEKAWMEMDRTDAQIEMMIRIREPLFKFCRKHNCKVKELSSTLLAAAVSDQHFLILHLGDGYMMGEYTDGWGVLSYPENGIRKNETVLTTSQPAAKHLRISKGNISDLQSICLCSDGWKGGLSALEQIQNAIAVKSVKNHEDDVSVIMMKKQ